MRKKCLILTVAMAMVFAIVGCGTTEKPVSEEPSKITQEQKEVDAENDKDNTSKENKEQVPVEDEKKDDDVQEEAGVKVDYITTNLENIFDEGSINYYDCVDRVIDDIVFKIPSNSDNFFIRADYTVLYDENEFSKYEQIFTASKYDVYMRRLNSTTYYIVFNTETEVGVEFAHTIRNYDEKTFSSILETFNKELEEYLKNK